MFKYGIYPHVDDWVYARTPWFGYFLNNPLLAFETGKHSGNLGKEVSIMKISTGQVDIMAFKKAEESDYYIVRVNELYGKDIKNVSVRLPGKIVDAYEVNGQEQKIGTADFSNGTLNFDMTRFLIRSFAVKLENPKAATSKPVQAIIELPYNEDGISSDKNRKDGNIIDNLTIPAELIPDTFESEDISFKTGNKADGKLNMLSAKGQKIKLPEGEYNKVYILAAATEDTKGNFKAGNQIIPLNIQGWTGFIGQHYKRVLYFNNLKVASLTPAFTKRDNIAWYASHRHTPEANDAYVYSYLYKYEISLPKGTGSIILPDNSKIKVFAITAAKNQNDNITPLQFLYDDFSENKAVQLRVKEYVTSDLKPAEYLLKPLYVNYDDRMVSRIKSYLISNKLDTTLVKTPPSSSDYADVNSGNRVSATYYATGMAKNGKEYKNEKIDISNILDSKNGKLRDTVLFDNGEGRIIIDLQKSVPVEKINMYVDQFRNRGSQIFSIWTSESSTDYTGDPKEKGWKYTGVYGLQSRAPGSSGVSFIFNNLTCRYIMFVSDGGWHGTEYLKQLDLTTRNR